MGKKINQGTSSCRFAKAVRVIYQINPINKTRTDEKQYVSWYILIDVIIGSSLIVT